MRNPAVVVDSHHKVLASWAACRARLASAPRLLTLDHHTDTSASFRTAIRKAAGSDTSTVESLRKTWISEIDFHEQASIERAVSRLSNDEHVVTAIQSRIISSALVIAHDARNTDLATYREHRIICHAVSAEARAGQTPRGDCDRVLESEFLENAIASFDRVLKEASESGLRSGEYIFDIDLDYFNTMNSIAPKDSRTLRELAAGAALVTIATEPEYVKHCALDAGLTSEGLLSALLELLGQVRP